MSDHLRQLNYYLQVKKGLAFITDNNLFATAVTSRRAGKTTACAYHLLHTANANPKSVCLYVTLARTNAKKIIWPLLQEFNRDLKLGGVCNQSDLSITFPNHSVIYCDEVLAQEAERRVGPPPSIKLLPTS